MIPKIIWQTYKDPLEALPEYIRECINTWTSLNPEYEYRYMNEDETVKFVLSEFGMDWYDIFINMPIGVMRADLWRYMVIYKYGGVYTDIDTLCLKPISEWVNNKYSAVLSEDDIPGTYNQITFAAQPGHIILKSVLDLIKNKFINPNYNDKNFVDKLTGVAVWTEAIKAIDKHLLDNIFIYSEDKNIYLENHEALYFDKAIKHLTASFNWNNGDYIQWQKQVGDFFDS